MGAVALIAATQGDLGRVYSFSDTPPAVSLLSERKPEDEGGNK